MRLAPKMQKIVPESAKRSFVRQTSVIVPVITFRSYNATKQEPQTWPVDLAQYRPLMDFATMVNVSRSALANKKAIWGANITPQI
jgi:hypothetical protein